MYRMYRNRRVFDAVWFLITVSSVIYLATILVPGLFGLLGLRPLLVPSRPWTLVTSMFVHQGIGHIFGNMVTLYFFGGFLSRLVGDRRFLVIYLLGGIVGGIFYLFLAQPFSIAVGASGAIFAVGGVLAVMRPKLRVFIFPIPIPLPLWVAVIGGFFILSFFPNVAWQAHLGGLLFGLIAGYFLQKRERRLF